MQSRYYDPAIGRFINADGLASTGQGILGCNMFAYCLNNPVNAKDGDGKIAGVDDAVFVTIAFFYFLICATAIYAATPEGQRGVAGFVDALSQAVEEVASNVPAFWVEAECGSPPPNSGNNNDDDDNDDDYYDDDYYDDDSNFGGRERIGKNKGKTPRSNEAQNRQFNEATKKLTKGQKRRVHEIITKKGYGREEIIEEAKFVLGQFMK